MALRSWLAGTAFACAVAAASPALAADSVSAGTLTVERPTLVSAGFDWLIKGDDNRNAQVELGYRKKGETAWRTGLPLMRAGGEIVGIATGTGDGPPPGAAGATLNNAADRYPLFKYEVPPMFAGSIFGLEPDTDYEARLTLSDPDGGGTRKQVAFHTRAEPKPSPDGKVYHVYPVDWKGPKQEPAFTGLMAAYYMGSAHYDYSNAYPPRVQPGDTILVHAGLYIGDRFHYLNTAPRPGALTLGNYFDGTYYLTAKGTAERPIAIKGAGDGEVIFDGDGAQNLFNLMGSAYNYVEGITVRNTNVAYLLGIKDIAGASGFTLKRTRAYDVGRVVQDDWSGSKDFYIADNNFNGRHDPQKMMGWNGKRWEAFPGFPELLLSEYAVKVYGQGHVVAYNHITNFHDAIDFATYGLPDGYPNAVRDRFPESVDIYGNDMDNMGDNCIEADGGGRNIRAFDNRCFNTAAQAVSVQPGFGGPFYWVRNVVYNSSGSVKYIENSAGILTYNNTFFAESRPGPAQNEHYRNNLFIGIGIFDPVFALTSSVNYNTSDYNGFRPNPGKAGAFEWNTPAFGTLRDYERPQVKRSFKTLADFSNATGQDTHSVLLDYDSFVHVAVPDQSDPQRVYDSSQYDFRLKPGSPAVDAGMVLPNITDGFAGKAPDLGAYELGAPLPHYGPR